MLFKLLQYVVIIVIMALPSITYTIMAPLFPAELVRREVSPIYSGINFR